MPALFKDLVLTPYREANFGPHIGPFLFEFQRHGLRLKAHIQRITDEMDCTWWDMVIENYDLFLDGANDMCE
jgi:hypothetical protein